MIVEYSHKLCWHCDVADQFNFYTNFKGIETLLVHEQCKVFILGHDIDLKRINIITLKIRQLSRKYYQVMVYKSEDLNYKNIKYLSSKVQFESHF